MNLRSFLTLFISLTFLTSCTKSIESIDKNSERVANELEKDREYVEKLKNLDELTRYFKILAISMERLGITAEEFFKSVAVIMQSLQNTDGQTPVPDDLSDQFKDPTDLGTTNNNDQTNNDSDDDDNYDDDDDDFDDVDDILGDD